MQVCKDKKVVCSIKLANVWLILIYFLRLALLLWFDRFKVYGHSPPVWVQQLQQIAAAGHMIIVITA